MTRYDNRHKNIRPQPPSKENHMMPKILKGDVISWSKDGYSWRRVDHAGGDTPVNTQPTEGWITRMPARPGVYTPPWKPQYYNECKTLRQTSSLQPPKQRATFRPLTFPNKLRIMYLLFFLICQSELFNKIGRTNLGAAASCLSCCRRRHHRLLVAWY